MESKDNYFKFLVVKAQQGAKNPYLELVDLFKNHVFLRALQLTCNIESANTIVSDVFIRAWNHIKLLNEFTPFELWLNGITVNISLTMFRESDSSLLVSDEEKSKINSKDNFDSIFLSLTAQSREILILHDLEGYKIESYAEILNESDIDGITLNLKNAREKFADEETLSILESYSEDDWSLLISDFDSWDLTDKPNDAFTQKLIIIKKYRDRLNSILSKNFPTEETLTGLKETLIQQGEKLVEARVSKAEKLKKVAIVTSSKVKKKKYVDDVTKMFTQPEAKEKLNKKLSERTKKRKTRKIISWGITAAAASIVLFSILTQSTYPWIIDSTSNNYRVNHNLNITEINKGDLLEVDEGGTVKLKIDHSEFTLNNHTAISALEDESSNASCNIDFGTFKLNSLKGTRVNVKHKNYKFIDAGSLINVKIEKTGTGVFQLIKGTGEILLQNKLIPLWKNYELYLGATIPVQTSLNNADKNSISKMDTPLKYNDAISSIINALNEKDALTLWCMLNEADNTSSKIIFNRLNYLFPIPHKTTQNGILKKNKKMLTAWLNSFEWQL